MALVSYDCSDSSDYEDNDEGDKYENNGKVSEVTLLGSKDKLDVNLEDKNKNDDLNHESADEIVANENPNNLLPPPVEIKSNFNVVSWSLLSKSRTQPIRISVPSLEDDVESEENKPKLKPSSKKSGLFALLPKPKQLLVPPSLIARKQVKKTVTVKSRQPVPNLKRPFTTATSTEISTKATSSSKENTTEDVEGDYDEEQPQSFFFLPKEEITVDHNIEIPNDDNLKESTSFQANTHFEDNNTLSMSQDRCDTSPDPSSNYNYPMLPESSSEIELNKEALEKLCGRRGKRLAGEVEMVDVSGAELVGDSKLWLAKDLTKEKVHFKRSKFDPMQRRKHQITFLAAHAREQELELSNQWASNRMTRKQTQAKYGF